MLKRARKLDRYDSYLQSEPINDPPMDPLTHSPTDIAYKKTNSNKVHLYTMWNVKKHQCANSAPRCYLENIKTFYQKCKEEVTWCIVSPQQDIRILSSV